MSKIINPTLFRLGITENWRSSWFAESSKDYIALLDVDLKIKKYIEDNFSNAGIDKIEITRTNGGSAIDVLILVAKPGQFIGRGGKSIEKAKNDLMKIVKIPVNLKPKEVKDASLSAGILAQEIVEGIQKRGDEKRLIMKAIDRAKRRGVKGILVQISGRIRASLHANTLIKRYGSIPLHTMRANIDYCYKRAFRKDCGIFGVKVWVCNGEKLD